MVTIWIYTPMPVDAYGIDADDLAVLRARKHKRVVDVATSYMSIGAVYFSQGQYERALENHQKTIDIKIRVVGHDHRTWLRPL